MAENKKLAALKQFEALKTLENKNEVILIVGIGFARHNSLA